MPTYRIIHSSTDGKPASVQSTFESISDQIAYKKFEEIINANEYTFSYLWLEYFNTETNAYEILKYPPK
jgi:hypothetical protein